MSKSQNEILDLKELGRTLAMPDGTCIFKPGDDSGTFFYVLDGAVRVEQTNSAGRTVVLYRVLAGDSCVMTTSSLLSGHPYSGYGYAEGNLRAVAIDAPKFRKLLSDNAAFRELVFQGFADRVVELTEVIDELLLRRVDLRLARWLVAHNESEIQVTQQDLAREIGTAREVISRTLRIFEAKGWIKLGRGSVAVLNTNALDMYAQSKEV